MHWLDSRMRVPESSRVVNSTPFPRRRDGFSVVDTCALVQCQLGRVGCEGKEHCDRSEPSSLLGNGPEYHLAVGLGQKTSEAQGSISLVLVSDAGPGLATRELDIYRFFRKPPRVVLARRGASFPIDRRIVVQPEIIHLPVIGLEDKRLSNKFLAGISVIGYLLHAVRLAVRLRRRKFNIQLVDAHVVLPQGLFGLILARLCRVPLVIEATGTDVNQEMRKNAALRAICRLVLARANAIIAPTRSLQRGLRVFGNTESVYLPNSVDTISIFPTSTPPKDNSILFVGRMTENKRPLLLLRSFEKVSARIADATLTMCGDGPLMEAVQKRILQKQLDGKVRVISHATPRGVIELLSQAEIFVLPSESEGMSFALLEAMASGKTIVASSNESHREVFQDKHGALLFQLDDEQDLAEQIISALTNRHLRSESSHFARELCVREFSNSEVGPRREKIYLEAIQSYRR